MDREVDVGDARHVSGGEHRLPNGRLLLCRHRGAAAQGPRRCVALGRGAGPGLRGSLSGGAPVPLVLPMIALGLTLVMLRMAFLVWLSGLFGGSPVALLLL